MENTILNDLKISLPDFQQEVLKIIYTSDYVFGLKEPFTSYMQYIKEKDKYRKIEIPNEIRCKYIQKPLAKLLQDSFERPVYCMGVWQGTNNIQNALIHVGKKFTITLDLVQFFSKTQSKYVKSFWQTMGFHGEDLERLMNLTTYEGHLPTGAPTSNILAALIHKPLFDVIYKKMQKQGIEFTSYVDDLTYSSDNHIPSGVIKYTASVLNTHGLRLNTKKIKRFGYKGAFITGIKTTQSGKLEMPYRQGYKVIKMLKAKSIDEMNVEELQKLIGKIGYIQQINPDGTLKSTSMNKDTKKYRPYFQTTKIRAIIRLNQIIENTKNKKEEQN